MRKKYPIVIAVAVMALAVAFTGVGAAQDVSVDSGQDNGVDTACHDGPYAPPPPPCGGGPCGPDDGNDNSDGWGFVGFDAEDDQVDTMKGGGGGVDVGAPGTDVGVDWGNNGSDGSVDVGAPGTDVGVDW